MGSPLACTREPGDPGAAIYFDWRGKSYALACDTYRTVGDTVRAIARTLEAMRTIERHGASQLLERAMSGFAALPQGENGADNPDVCWAVLGIPDMDETKFSDISGDRGHPHRARVLRQAEVAYRAKVPTAHPDLGGSPELMRKLNDAIKSVREALS